MTDIRPMGVLKDFLATTKRDTRLLGDVERWLLKQPASDRPTNVLHPSEIVKTDWCLRASYFALCGVKTKHVPPSLRLQNIFDEGHAIHAKWQDRFRQMGVLYGTWTCRGCGCSWEALSPPQCRYCKHEPRHSRFGVDYKEVPLYSSPEYRIAGHADGLIVGIGDPCLIEIKSIGMGTIRAESPSIVASANGDLTAAWREIKRPFRSHLLQGALYLELLRQMHEEYPQKYLPKEIVFIYELKSDQSIKEFPVYRDSVLVQDILAKAKQVVRAVDRAVPLKCSVDPDRGCAKCKVYDQP